MARVYRCLSEQQTIAGVPRSMFWICLGLGSSPIVVAAFVNAGVTPWTFLYAIALIYALIFVAKLLTKRNPYWHIDMIHARAFPQNLSPHLNRHAERIRHNRK